MRTLFVTGGAGFIGGNFVRQQGMRDGVRVVNLDKLTYAGNLQSLASLANRPNYTFVHGDIADSELVSQLLQQHQPTHIINFAAESHVDRSIDAPATFVQTNVVGTFQLLEATRRYWQQLPKQAADAFRFLQVSTDEVFGSLDGDDAFTEKSPYRPNSPYAASKAAADHFVRAYHQTYALPVLTTNCSNNYGPYQFPEKLVPLMILNAIDGRPLPIYGDGLQIRDWLHVDDHCRGIELALTRGQPGDVYHFGGNQPCTNLELVNRICELVDRLAPELGSDLAHRPCSKLIEHVEDRPGHDRRYEIDTTKARSDLGWQPQQSLAAGLESTVRWYLENKDWVEGVLSGEYRRERLGLG